jgi:hypothetical protein
MKVTVLRDNRTIFDSVCWYVAENTDTCNHLTVEMIGENNISFVINESTAFKNITVTPIYKGDPVSAAYDSQPKVYRELVIEGPDKREIAAFITEAKLKYEKKCKLFEKSDTHVLVLIWDGCRWTDEYRTPQRSNKSIYLPDDSYSKVLNDLNSFYHNKKRYQELEVPHVRTYMLHGLPGTGKTSMIYTIATELNKNIAILDFSNENMSDSSIRRAVYKMPENTILCMEDMDALFSKDRKSDKSTITFSGVLNILDGIIKNPGMVIFMTTNLLENIDDKAMKRRVDYYLKFELMKKEQIENMVRHFYPDQDSKKFISLVSKLQLTPCILQKFFVRHINSHDIAEYIDELVDMCENDYRIINSPSSIYT